MRLEQCWRWFGPTKDPIPLSHIRQAGATGIVSALHDLKCGDYWSPEAIAAHKGLIEEAGLTWTVVESLPVHEDIKRRAGDFERYLDIYVKSLRNLAAAGIQVICYNFMAVTDWTRTDLAMPLAHGGTALRFDWVDYACFELYVLDRNGAEFSDEVVARAQERWESFDAASRKRLTDTILKGLPGTVDDLSVDQFKAMLATYDDISVDQLRANHIEFLKAVVPVAEEEGVKLAIHPDDPPFPIFGLPRVACTEADLVRIVESVPSPSNGLTYCTGSLGANPENDLVGIVHRLGDHIHFLHLRSVAREPDGSFYEDDHLAGSSSMVAIMTEIVKLCDSRGISLPMRPDHGHLLGSDLDGPSYYSGYSYIGRLKGLAELRGLEMGIQSQL